MFSTAPLPVSESILEAIGMRMSVHHQERIPEGAAVVVVSNHRSFMDASVLIAALSRPVRIACHHYMGQVPVMREIVHLLGCFPLEQLQRRQHGFFERATEFLQAQQWVGIFPEGAQPMVELTPPREVGKFHRGFAHLALRVPISYLAVLPVAIASVEESLHSGLPIRFLRLFDPSEPLFDRCGLHPVVIYRRVSVLIGHPYWITEGQRQQYQGRGAKKAVSDLTEYCQEEIAQLLAGSS